ncbi:hypothetical protein ABID42_004702 [Arcicella rosea]|uniref:phage integrase SAM-like domain-containing protein n=1 Tax=Arcicella rosea TaxID=502909 RepID=UPI00345CED28
MNIKIRIKDFDTKRQLSNDTTVNNKLTNFKADVNRLIEQLSAESTTANSIKDIITGKTKVHYSLLEILDMFMKGHEKIFKHNTYRDWRAKRGKIEKYLTKELKDKNIEARLFNIIAFSKFKNWLIANENNTVNSANKYGTKIRKALSWAVMNGYITSSPLAECKIPVHYQEKLTHLEWI